jgi:hypothetical protein
LVEPIDFDALPAGVAQRWRALRCLECGGQATVITQDIDSDPDTGLRWRAVPNSARTWCADHRQPNRVNGIADPTFFDR